jgi:hypothetical protein
LERQSSTGKRKCCPLMNRYTPTASVINRPMGWARSVALKFAVLVPAPAQFDRTSAFKG